jgi:hypothetical protein
MKLIFKFQVFEKLADIPLISKNSKTSSQFNTRAVRAASDHQGR